MVESNIIVYALQHITDKQFICALWQKHDYVICFSDGDTAIQFRSELGAEEHCNIIALPVDYFPDGRLYLDGKFINRFSSSTISK